MFFLEIFNCLVSRIKESGMGSIKSWYTQFLGFIFFAVQCCIMQSANIDWNLPATQISLSANGAPAVVPSIATDGSHTVIAIWVQAANNLYGAWFDLASKQWSVPTLIGTGNTIIAHRAVIVGENRAIVVWSDNNNNLYGTVFTPGSTSTREPLAANFQNFDYLSIVEYGNGSALIAYIDTSNKVKAGLYIPGSGVTWVDVSASTTGTNRKFPFIAVQPGTNIAFIVWAADKTIFGRPFYYPFTSAPAEYTSFAIASLNYDKNDPKIAFNANSDPVVFWGANPSNTPQLVGTLWKNPTTSQTIPVSAVDRISLYPLNAAGNLLRFNVTADGPNSFKVVYAQNNSSGNKVYAALYVPGTSQPFNYEITSASEFSDVLSCFPQVANVGSDGRNIIVWEQGSKIFGTTFVPGLPFDPIQLSTDTTGTSFDGLSMVLVHGLPIVVWAQGTSASTAQIFGVYGIQAPPNNVIISREIHRFFACCDVVDVITWQAAKNAVSYQIYQSTHLSYPLGTVYADKPLIFRRYGRNPCVSETYYVYAVDINGNTSSPVVVTAPVFKS